MTTHLMPTSRRLFLAVSYTLGDLTIVVVHCCWFVGFGLLFPGFWVRHSAVWFLLFLLFSCHTAPLSLQCIHCFILFLCFVLFSFHGLGDWLDCICLCTHFEHVCVPVTLLYYYLLHFVTTLAIYFVAF